MLTRRHSCSALLGALAGFGSGWAARPALALDYPTRTVHIVVPFLASGGTDILARLAANRLAERWRRPCVVDNMPGGSGGIATRAVMRAAPDGYTLLMASTGALLAAASGPDGSPADDFDITKLLAPIALLAAPPYVVTVNPAVPARSVATLVDLARARQARGEPLRYGSSGAGAASHLIAVLFAKETGVTLTHVPYQGTGEAMQELLSGRIDLLFAPPQTVRPVVDAGRLVPVALTGATRSPLFARVPTLAEAGIAGFDSVGWFGLLAPRHTPDDIVARLESEVTAVLAEPAVLTRLAELGAEPQPITGTAFARFINTDIARWTPLMRDAGIVPAGGPRR
ncbi:MAG: tripartite tricarboxylate transporter substrate binding protein [Rhodoplanes sp.]|uniref:Bug family tripartite tricarboxylate transporter substrate binding protein n=1 Tax=Rhodoplanes sp. TaxID=1968906 RepID=UPI0018437D68|nr:tripartite tricarboxylate transporter substrate binding protein [Rhodoplanes sp.]NVO13744.1 tripartite tricarboxylate transporter substrate binding protein [Rhodoplanes sp.]